MSVRTRCLPWVSLAMTLFANTAAMAAVTLQCWVDGLRCPWVGQVLGGRRVDSARFNPLLLQFSLSSQHNISHTTNLGRAVYCPVPAWDLYRTECQNRIWLDRSSGCCSRGTAAGSCTSGWMTHWIGRSRAVSSAKYKALLETIGCEPLPPR